MFLIFEKVKNRLLYLCDLITLMHNLCKDILCAREQNVKFLYFYSHHG